MSKRTETLPSVGVDLYFEVRGRGPMLVISQSGEGDANRSEYLARQLEEEFTIVTYDRRGLSRSTLHGNRAVSISRHAEDVVQILDYLTDEPAAMLGCSLGATIGLHIAASEPSRLSTLIAHEPVAPWLLPEATRTEHLKEIEQTQECFHRRGWQAALGPMARSLGIDPVRQEHEPGVVLPPITPEREANFARFLGYDLEALQGAALEKGALRASSVRIIPAAGSLTPRDVFDYQCAEALAAEVDTSLTLFPGGHNGNLTHPTHYARVVRKILSTQHL